jgi:hypothetical protein
LSECGPKFEAAHAAAWKEAIGLGLDKYYHPLLRKTKKCHEALFEAYCEADWLGEPRISDGVKERHNRATNELLTWFREAAKDTTPPSRGAAAVEDHTETLAEAIVVPPAEQDPPASDSPANEKGLPDWIVANFSRNQLKLMRLLWGKGEVPIADICEKLYGSKQPTPNQLDALARVKTRTNSTLERIHQRYEIRERSGTYILLPIV